MNIFETAQPALLYIVPAVLGAVGLHAWANRQFKQVLHQACIGLLLNAPCRENQALGTCQPGQVSVLHAGSQTPL